MALPSKVNFVTFDVYGTLIDWEKGVFDAFKRRPRATASRSTTRRRSSPASTSTSARSRAAPTSSTPRSCAAWPCDRQGHRLAAGALARRLPARLRRALGAVQGDQPAAEEVRQEVPDRPDLEHRRQAPGPDAPPHPARLRPRRHRPAGALLQARSRPLQGVRAAHRHQEGLGAHRGQLLPRRRAVPEGEGPGHLGQPQQGGARRRARRSRRPRSRPSSRRPSCSARRSAPTRHARRLACTPTSSSPRRGMWQTTCTRAALAARRAFVVDSPVFPDELDALPARARAGRLPGQRPAGHPRRLGPRARPPRLPRRGARRGRDDRRAPAPASPATPQRELRAFDEEHYVERPRRCRSARSRRCRCPGTLGLGEHELELHPADGHTADGMAVWAPWARVLVCGDYLSPVEIPCALAEPARATPTWRRSSACAPLVERGRRGSCPATAPRSTAPARWPSSRGRALPDRLGAAAHAADCRAARGRRREPPAGRRSSLKPTSPR